MKSILFVTYANPFTQLAGDSIYTVNILRSLMISGYSIDIVYYDSNEFQPELPEEEVNKFRKTTIVPFTRKSNIRLVLSLYPGMVASRRSKNYKKVILDQIKHEDYSAILINHFRMAFVSEFIQELIPLVYLSHNAEYRLSLNNYRSEKQWLRKMVYLWDAMRTFYYERRLVRQASACSAICEYDYDYLQNLKKQKSVIIRPVIESESPVIACKSQFIENIRNLVVVGSYTWGPKANNILALAEAYTQASMNERGFSLTIVGRIEAKLKKRLHEINSSLIITGRVPSIASFYDNNSIAIIPEVMGGGFKIKVAEAGYYVKAIFAVEGAITKTVLRRDDHYVESPSLSALMEDIVKRSADPMSLWAMANKAKKVISEEYTIEAQRSQLEALLG